MYWMCYLINNIVIHFSEWICNNVYNFWNTIYGNEWKEKWFTYNVILFYSLYSLFLVNTQKMVIFLTFIHLITK